MKKKNIKCRFILALAILFVATVSCRKKHDEDPKGNGHIHTSGIY